MKMKKINKSLIWLTLALLGLSLNMNAQGYSGGSETFGNPDISNPVHTSGIGELENVTPAIYAVNTIPFFDESTNVVISNLLKNTDGNGIVYVNAKVAGGNNNGASWADAFTYLQDALALARNTPEVSQIWVAAGVYYPDEGTGQTNDDRNATFSLVEGVKIYGGFNGTETDLSQRYIAANPTILSGDIDGNDTNTDGNYIAETTADIAGENSFHVVTADGTGATNITTDTELNGFVVTAGNADGTSPKNTGGGLLCNGSSSGNASSPSILHCVFIGNSAFNNGGAISNYGVSGTSSPIIANSSFSGNSAGEEGGAISNYGSTFGISNPIVTNCIFYQNFAGTNGGAICNYGSAGNSIPILSNCSFIGNSAGIDGGAIYNFGSSGTSSPILTNCSFNANVAGYCGGAIFNGVWGNGVCSPVFTNCSFSINTAERGGATFNIVSNFGTCNPLFTNSILWGNTATDTGNEVYNLNATATFSFCTISGSGGSGSAWAAELGMDGGNNIDNDPMFVDAATGDLRISGISPCADAGNDAANTELTDIRGEGFGRKLDKNDHTLPGTIDMGAYEYKEGADPVTTRLYVNENVTGGNNDGTSWADAFTYLQDALALARITPEISQIWVAAGVYYPDEGTGQTDNDRTATFSLVEGLKIYGGFNGTEADLSQRDITANPTILSGDIDGNDTNTDGNYIAETTADIVGDNSFHVVTADGTGVTNITTATELNGFVVTAASATGDYPNGTGAGLFCNGSGPNSNASPYIAHCSFYGNFAYFGGAIYNYGNYSGCSSPIVTNCHFSGNSADYNGGAILNSGYQGTSSPTIINCSFSNNNANIGAAIYNNGSNTGYSNPTFINCSFSINHSAVRAGAMFNSADNGTSNPILTNCIVWGNTATLEGPEFFNSGTANPNFSYCNIAGSGGSGSGWDTGLGTDSGGNIDSDPMFVDAAAGDLRIHGISPCADTGNNTANAEPTDIRGGDFGRKLDKNNHALPGTIDMGAYEYKEGTDPSEPCRNPTDGGTIAASQNICSGTSPEPFTSITLPTGYLGTIEYKWQICTSSPTFADIPGAASETYTHVGTVNQTTWFRRLARVDCTDDWTGAAESNVVKIAIDPPGPLTRVNIRAEKAEGGKVKFIATAINGGDNPTFKWYKSDANGVVLLKEGTDNYIISTCKSGDEHYVVMQSSLPCTAPAESNAMCTY
jgi:hypothetical protein